ncbi:MAG: ribosome maturation factor RimP [Clostridia bacterium]|nr:ribosome maturation factor RimP [Clostridia bacterium]
MTADIIKKIGEVITPYAKQLNLNIADIEYKKKYDGMNLTIFIYTDEGAVTIKDCEKLHKLIDAPLDELNPTDNKTYTLNVSSIGLDRPLKNNADFERNLGKEIEIKFFAPFNGSKKIDGTLLSFCDDILKVKIKDEILQINRQDTAKITLKINF